MAMTTREHQPVGYDQDGRPFDCAECGGRWPCLTEQARIVRERHALAAAAWNAGWR